MTSDAGQPVNASDTFWFGCPAPAVVPLNPQNATAQCLDIAERAEVMGYSRLASALVGNSSVAQFLGSVFDLSPYIRDGVRAEPGILDRLFDLDIAARILDVSAAILALPFETGMSELQLMRDLRVLKREAHMLIALSDLAGEADGQETVARLSSLAVDCVNAAIDFLLLDAHHQGKLALPDLSIPGVRSGFVVLAMGKLGAGELNFSSDIDLIILIDTTAPAIPDPYEAVDLFVRLTRRLVRILQDRTEHGYVFRTDLRLRPDPGSTPLALPVSAALLYYESRGQNWERAAMIKARAIAGDVEAGVAFLRELQPYVWRKYLDYAAIADIHSIKRQIHAHRGHGEVAVLGHNVKLGRGGIREVEFFVQTQQLIAGGRFPDLRGRETVAMLDKLAERGWIANSVCEDMVREYWFLRDVENAIQMVADEQTHLLPDDEPELRRIALMLGFADGETFSERFRAALHVVEKHYAALFETAPKLSQGMGNLVFTGDVDDPDTLHTLSSLGFERPSDICRVIRGWHFGRYRATQSAEARERLTALTPALLETFGRTQRADEALLRFDEFLAGLPAGIQLFSLLQSNPRLLDMLATIMGAAPRLSSIITRQPHVFDGLLDPVLLSELPSRAYIAERLDAFLAGTTVYEDALDRLRIFAAEQKFLIGMRLLTGSIDAMRAGRAFSDLAELTIQKALGAVRDAFAVNHGHVPGGRVALVGLGRLGSRELTAGSDVDLILLYDHDDDAEESDGAKPLAPSQYFGRLTQRLIAAVSAPTAEGVLYELDLRLRPSGNKGPVATHISSFRKYQQEEAWTWEHMALTRARCIAGDEAFCAAVDEEITAIVASPRDPVKIRADALEMRRLIETEKPASSIWDLKLIPGGIIDIEFIAQVFVLCGLVTNESGREGKLTGTSEILAAISPKAIAPQMRDDLLAAYDLYMTLTQISRLCLTGPIEPDNLPPGLVDIFLRAVDLPELNLLETHLRETAAIIRTHFRTLLEA